VHLHHRFLWRHQVPLASWRARARVAKARGFHSGHVMARFQFPALNHCTVVRILHRTIFARPQSIRPALSPGSLVDRLGTASAMAARRGRDAGHGALYIMICAVLCATAASGERLTVGTTDFANLRDPQAGPDPSVGAAIALPADKSLLILFHTLTYLS
jgi:hypothetical protein